jgi:hypothetical protein
MGLRDAAPDRWEDGNGLSVEQRRQEGILASTAVRALDEEVAVPAVLDPLASTGGEGLVVGRGRAA